MAAFPTTDLPGHERLHLRVAQALDLCQETPAVEFKESAEWKAIRNHLAKTAMAMANLRDGGVIIIGVSQRDQSWNRTGIAPEHLKSFKPDEVEQFINKFASPTLTVDTVLAEIAGATYLVLGVREFVETPCVCKRDGADNSGIRRGAFYLRQPGPPQTTIALNAEHMHELLELAAEKRARRILEVSRRIGLVLPDDDAKRFDSELGGL